jgi:hypothetical protein
MKESNRRGMVLCCTGYEILSLESYILLLNYKRYSIPNPNSKKKQNPKNPHTHPFTFPKNENNHSGLCDICDERK